MCHTDDHSLASYYVRRVISVHRRSIQRNRQRRSQNARERRFHVFRYFFQFLHGTDLYCDDV